MNFEKVTYEIKGTYGRVL